MTGLEVTGLSVWLPGRGIVLNEVDLALPQGSVTLLAGRNGSGHSTLLNALAARLPVGAMTRGDLRIDRRLVTGFTAAELGGAVRFHAGRPPVQWPARGCRLLLLDQILGQAPAGRRTAIAQAVADVARRGTTVVWAEHYLEHAVPVADLVLESLPGGEHRLAEVVAWSPRTVPAPPLMALARALGLPRESWLDADSVAPHAEVRGALPGAGGFRWHTGDTLAVVAGETIGLPGSQVEVRYGEPLGIVSVTPGDGRDLLVARALRRQVTRLPQGPLAGTATGQSAESVAAVCRAWERCYGLPADAVAERLRGAAGLRPAASLGHHSDGERAVLRWALETAKPGLRLLVEPTLGLDPAARRAFAEELAGDAASATLVVSGDPEFLVRACRRILVVDGERMVGDGSPAAVLGLLPGLPQIAELCTPRPVTRVRDCLAGLTWRRTA